MSEQEAMPNTDMYRDIGYGLIDVAKAMANELGPTETARMLFSLWLSFMAQHQPPETTAALLRRIAGELESGTTFARTN